MLFAFLFDLLALILYFFQKQDLTTSRFTIGLIGQTMLVFALLVLVFSYKGKKYSQVQPVIGMRYFSIRFALIVFSFIGGQKIYFYEALSKTYLVSSLPTKMIKTDDQE
ncbi:hypothetical protein [Enterococcus lemanii]|jgi:hypothetical protein|uniref:RDD domain-containing protein n=1 Tax=Enterococcus lemanii TaxID=1159752 RepID=A0ABV9MT99_9ENTE|nr:hypothetical protein [Enterococcus lemanii]MBM7708574.1 putative membrane protein [Enterococcus lemanii]NLM68208.1 hypothetical protein [Enterococcus sp.]